MPRFFRSWIVSIALFAPSAWGATIQKINVPKKTLTIDGGTEAGFQKKAKVCFYEAEVKIGCGVVRTVKPASATIKIKNAKTLAKLKEGQEARLETAGATPTAGSAVATAESGGTAAAPNSVKLFLIGSLTNSPVSHANLFYQTPQNKPVESLWAVDATKRANAAGIGTELGFGIGSYTLGIGLRVRPDLFYKSKKIASDYDDKDADAEGYFEQYAETTSQGSSAFGFFVNFYYLSVDWGVAGFYMGNGLDFDSSVVKFKSEKKDEFNPDADQTLYSATSKLTAILLRTDLMLDFTFGSFGFHAGSVISIPLSQTQKFSLDTEDDPFASNLQDKTATEDLKKSLDHKANFAVDLLFGIHFNY